MAKLSILTWIGNAAAVLCGRRGDVTRQAQQAGCSRQAAYQHAHQVQQAVTELQAGGPSREELLRACQQLQEENQQLWDGPAEVGDGPPQQQQQQFGLEGSLMAERVEITVA